MKKIISILLVTMLLISTISTVAFAEVAQEPIKDEYLYLNTFLEVYKEDIFYNDYIYEELYCHRDSNNSIDWVLVMAQTSPPPPANYYWVFGDMVSLRGWSAPFKNMYAVYDVAKNEYIDICDLKTFDVYDGLKEQIYALNFLYPIGDADRDKKITILDATYIQRVLAKLIIFPTDDLTSYLCVTPGELNYLSDIDRDGKRNICDATAIQMKLAKLNYPVATADEVLQGEAIT